MSDKTELAEYKKRHAVLLRERREMLSEYSGTNDPAAVREYIENKLIDETANDDPKVRLKATELLGKMTDIAAFTDRKQVVFTDESDDSLKERLEKLLGKPIDGEVIDGA